METKKPNRRPSKEVGQLHVDDELQTQEIFTVKEAAAFLRVGRQQIDYAIRHRRLKVLQLTRSRRCIRIYRPDLMRLLDVVR